MSASMLWSMNHSPIAAPEYGARNWLAAVSEAGAETTIVYCIALAFSRIAMARATFEFFWPMAT